MGKDQNRMDNDTSLIMEKTIDIYKYGTAFSRIESIYHDGPKPIEERKQNFRDKFQDILKDGLIGIHVNQKNKPKRDQIIDQYKAHLSSNEGDLLVHFNIVGRMRWPHFSREPVGHNIFKDSAFLGGEGTSIALVFDLSAFIEKNPEDDLEKWTYKSNDPETLKIFNQTKRKVKALQIGDYELRNKIQSPQKNFDENGFPRSESQWGFVLAPRIPKRLLRGIIFSSKEGEEAETVDLLSKTMMKASEEYGTPILPIYDVKGNIWWPKKIDYRDIKKSLQDAH
jgi:hypothetical protein